MKREKTMRPFYPSQPSPLPRNVSRRAGRSWKFVLALCCALVFPSLLAPVASCGNSGSSSAKGHSASLSGFRIESAAFKEGAGIPARFTCEGEDVSPPLAWTVPPRNARSLVLIVDDPDAPAGVWTHWVVYNLPAQTRAMVENTPKQGELPGGGLQGRNSFGRIGYGGPCPPPGRAHRYFFRLYALDTLLKPAPGASRQDVLAAAKGHIVGEAQLMGRFKR